MTFQFFPLRFEFIARDPLYFPPGKSGNTLRGAMGAVFQRIGGVPACLELAMPGPRPSGLSEPPRPFVLRARHLDGRAFQADEPFHFDLHVFSLDPGVSAYFVHAFAELAREGLGMERSKAELRRVVRLGLHGLPEQTLYTISTPLPAMAVDPVTLDLAPVTSAPRKIRVDFLSPTELKSNARIVSRPEFPVLFARIRDRISTLSELYGAGPLGIDFQRTGIRAEAIRMTSCEVTRREVERHSTRTGQTHSIGGFVGSAEYEGDMEEFLPYLEAARWTGVGRQVVWGKGEISVR